MTQTVQHAFAPVFDEHSRVLILGTMPSPLSREHGFYYSNPRNRFWAVLAELFGCEMPETAQEKRNFALAHGIALWDVLASCEIVGASDASIRSPHPNDIPALLAETGIEVIFTTGSAAAALYRRFFGGGAKALPSTSPANARMSLAALVEKYKIILEYVGEN